jgi:hypothetical protein
VDTGLINPDVLREARANQVIEDGFYPGFEQAAAENDLEPDEDEHDMLELETKKQGLINMSMPPAPPGAKPVPGAVPKTNGSRPLATSGKTAKPPVG